MNEQQNDKKQPRRLGRRLAPIATAAAVGLAAGAGVYAATDDGGASQSAAPVVAAHPAASRATSLSIAEIYKQAAPGVVDITVAASSSSGNLDPFGQGQGQGRETQAE